MSRVIVVAVIVLTAAVAGWILGRRGAPSADGTAGESAQGVVYDLLGRSRGGDVRAPRYLVLLTDQGGPGTPPEMRWRWIVWDADLDLRVAAYPERHLDPEGEAGVEVPYMLANTSTEAFATLNAARWVRDHGADAFVLMTSGRSR